jgi:acyl-CoA thioesterase-1
MSMRVGILPVSCILGLVMLSSCTSKSPSTPPVPEKPAKVETQLAAPDPRPGIVAFGDSLTAGLGVAPDQNYPAKLQRRLEAEGYQYQVRNEGVSGETSAQGLERTPLIREMRPAVVILEFGANDGLRGIPVEVTRQNLDRIMQQFVADGTGIVLAGMEVPPNYGAAYTSAFRSIFPELSSKHRAALIPFFLAGVGGVQDLNQEDGIHPTPRGYDLVVENVWKALVPLLAK